MRRTAPSGVRRVASLTAAVASELGGVREDNQDRVAIARGRDRLGRVELVRELDRASRARDRDVARVKVAEVPARAPPAEA